MILAIGNSTSFEVESFKMVVDILVKKGIRAILFKQDQCLKGETLVYEMKNGLFAAKLKIDGQFFDIDDFSAIWYMKPYLPKDLLNFNPVEYRVFIDRQFRAMRMALWSIFRDKTWLNDPWSMEMAENKVHQLHLAIQSGFEVPETIISSDPSLIRDFHERIGHNMVVKLLMSSPIVDHVIYTNLVTEEYMAQIESVKMAPSIFQAIIPKSYELRITVVGKKVFAAKIYSQDDEATSLDWRRKPKINDFNVKMEATEIPIYIKEKIFNLMEGFNLRFGCIDMIVKPDGQYVFLEINPNGQWYFVQLHTGLQIAEAITEILTS